MPTSTPPETAAHSLRVIVDAALERATNGNASLLVGRCTEASILAYAALKDAGYDQVVMWCGEWRGYMGDAARDFFPFDLHSWTEVHIDGYGWVVVDPTQWVFDFDYEDPGVYVTDGSDARYAKPRYRSFKTSEWQDNYVEWLAACGFDTTGLPGSDA